MNQGGKVLDNSLSQPSENCALALTAIAQIATDHLEDSKPTSQVQSRVIRIKYVADT